MVVVRLPGQKPQGAQVTGRIASLWAQEPSVRALLVWLFHGSFFSGSCRFQYYITLFLHALSVTPDASGGCLAIN